jgi:hypothetical protein
MLSITIREALANCLTVYLAPRNFQANAIVVFGILLSINSSTCCPYRIFCVCRARCSVQAVVISCKQSVVAAAERDASYFAALSTCMDALPSLQLRL